MSKTKILSRYILTFLSVFIMFGLFTNTKMYYFPVFTASLFGDATVNNSNSFSLCYSALFAVFLYYLLGNVWGADKATNRKTIIKNTIAVIFLFVISAVNI